MQPVDLNKIIKDIKTLGRTTWLTEYLTDAFEQARKGKRTTNDEHNFESHTIKNIERLVNCINEHIYEPSSSIAFIISDPKKREIFAAPFRDRIVHHFLYNMQGGWWDRRFVATSSSCRVGKGTLYGIKKAQRQMRQVSHGGTRPAMVVKMDLQGYLMSLPRRRLYKRVKWGLDKQFKNVLNDSDGYWLYRLCCYLWKAIIFDDPASKARRRGPLSNWNPNNLPLNKSLFAQEAGYGIVIGNLTSQLVSNIYLNALDRYITRTLGYKYYGRYVDDFYIMVPLQDYQRLKQDIRSIEAFLKNELELTLHPIKRYHHKVSEGMEFLGCRVYPNTLYPSDRLQAKFHRAMEEVMNGRRDADTVVSYLGLMKHMNAEKFIKKSFNNEGWDYEP